ncbi:MAG: MMPL family transporter [Candidatus Heimdallarchaeota archaeon]|nr:MMPL family transporter [Candidatus Heimdallarchaeota archaeon]
MNTFDKFILRFKTPFLIIIIVLGVILVPKGIHSNDQIGNDIRNDLLSEEDDVYSFNSISSDIVFLIKGNETIISEYMYTWIANFTNYLEKDPVIRKSIIENSDIEYIFEQSQLILRPYLNSLFFTICIANVTSFLLINGTTYFIENWNNQILSNPENATLNTRTLVYSHLTSILDTLSMGIYLKSFVDEWLSLYLTYSSVYNSTLTKDEIIEDWHENPTYWTSILRESQYLDVYEYFLQSIDIDTIWSYNFLFREIANLLFGNSSDDAISFLDDLFDGGNVASPYYKTEEHLIDFIKGTYIPYGFPESIREYYLSVYTNYKPDSPITVLALQMRIRSDLNKSEVDSLLIFLENLISNLDDNELGLDFYILSQLLYNSERGQSISAELHMIDILSLVFGFIILMIYFRDLVISVLIMVLSYVATQISKALIISTVSRFFTILDSSFSMAITLMLGASLNYCVFFAHRFIEEKRKGTEKSIEVAMSTALHSIRISGIAIVLTFLPLVWSSLEIIQSFALVTILGIIVILLFLNISIPLAFSLIEPFVRLKTSPKILPKRITRFVISSRNAKRVVIISFLIGLISLGIVLSSESSFILDDFIGDDGKTGVALEIINTEFPANYYSKILISFDLMETIDFGLNSPKDVINSIGELSSRLYETTHFSSVISVAWPMGEPFDFTNNSIALVPRSSALIVVDQLMNKHYNHTSILLQLKYDADDIQSIHVVTVIRSIVADFSVQNKDLSNIEIMGTIAESELDYITITEELPIQVILSLFLLTIFLYFRMRSISVPIRLESTILLGVVYALAVATILWMILFSIPINLLVILLSIIILLALGTDFDIFIYTRIQEEYHLTSNYEKAVKQGIQQGSSAIIISGLVMAFSFLSLYWGSLGLTRQFGIVTFLSIIIDIFYIRQVLVPALLLFKPQSQTK